MGRSPFTVRDGRAPRVIQVIRHEIIRGDGRETVMRGVMQYHSLQGDFLAEHDPCRGSDLVKDKVSLRKDERPQ